MGGGRGVRENISATCNLFLSLFFQYIAPLMANFDTSNNQQAKIRYLDDGEKLVVEWKDVYLQVSNSNAGKS